MNVWDQKPSKHLITKELMYKWVDALFDEECPLIAIDDFERVPSVQQSITEPTRYIQWASHGCKTEEEADAWFRQQPYSDQFKLQWGRSIATVLYEVAAMINQINDIVPTMED